MAIYIIFLKSSMAFSANVINFELGMHHLMTVCQTWPTDVHGVSQDLPSQPPGSHFDSQTHDFWENDTQLYFARFSVFV